jgi:class 3 adenylate cyclase
MQCSSCGSNVTEGSKFCVECGSPLPRACPTCGHRNPPQARFCAECGATQVAILLRPIQPSSMRVSSTAVAERRQLTVMFCDLVESSALSTRLDPEEHRDVVSAFQSCCTSEITVLDGMVAQYLGDGVLAYFGYPTAHEDDAERAVRAGLAILDAVCNFKPVAGVSLQVRIGIASGIVVVGVNRPRFVGGSRS